MFFVSEKEHAGVLDVVWERFTIFPQQKKHIKRKHTTTHHCSYFLHIHLHTQNKKTLLTSISYFVHGNFSVHSPKTKALTSPPSGNKSPWPWGLKDQSHDHDSKDYRQTRAYPYRNFGLADDFPAVVKKAVVVCGKGWWIWILIGSPKVFGVNFGGPRTRKGLNPKTPGTPGPKPTAYSHRLTWGAWKKSSKHDSPKWWWWTMVIDHGKITNTSKEMKEEMLD